MRPLLLPLLVVLAGPAIAQDQTYPFSGYFSAAEGANPLPTGVVDPTPDDMLARCAINIVDQKADGSYSNYLIDLEAFSTGELIYRRVITGICDYDPRTRAETCTTQEQSASLTDELTFFDGLGLVTEDTAQIVFYETMEDATAGANSVGYFSYFRCPVDVGVIAEALDEELATWSEEEISALRFPSEELLASPEVRAVGEAIAR